MKTQLQMNPNESSDAKFYSYPAHKVLGVIDSTESAKKAIDDLKQNGFHDNEIEVITNAGQVDFSGEEHGFWGRIVRTLQHMSSEGRYLDRYEQELKEGHILLTVTSRDTETKEKVKDILHSHGGHRLTYFGNWTIEGLPESELESSETHPYGLRRDLEIPFDEAVEKTRNRLQEEGFGVLTEIDMKAKLKEKLGVDFRNYVILGACSPPLAHTALQEDLDIGLLLPCNVVVYESNGGSVVAAIDAAKMLAVTDNPKLDATAKTVNEKLRRAIENI